MALFLGSECADRSRIMFLNNQLSGPQHPAWARFDEERLLEGQYALEILASNLQDFDLEDDLGSRILGFRAQTPL